MHRFIFLLFLISGIALKAQDIRTINGYVYDENGEALMFANVYLENGSAGTNTNEYGYFSLQIPISTTEVLVTYLGYQTYRIQLTEENDIVVKMKPDQNMLSDVEITYEQSQQETEHKSSQMSSITIPVKKIKSLPAIGGETDVIKVMQLMPGVQSGAEGGTSMFVRGGDADQNLVLIDEAIVYNVGHLFGFFSVFNPDAIKDMTLLKGAFPSNYGGRLSSILDIRMKEGADDKIHVQGGVGLLSSRLTIEGPINKKSSFMVSGRRTYIDAVFKLVGSDIPYYFYDLNMKYNYKFDVKNRLYVSGYYGNDVLSINEDVEDTTQQSASALNFGFVLGNYTTTVRWNHVYNDKLFSNLSLIYTRFNYDIQGSFVDNSLFIQSKVRDLGAKLGFDLYLNPRHRIKYGINLINHSFRPNVISTEGEISDFLLSRQGNRLNAFENGIYGLSQYDITEKWQVNAGLRLSGVLAKDKYFQGVEPRLATRYTLTDKQNVKGSISRMYQYMHKVSSSTVALPTDLWYPVTANVRPQYADQLALGYSLLLKKMNTTLTVEGYYKWMYNLTEYREGANLVLNDQFESELLQGTGRSWGVEFLAKKDEGKLTGWIGYTLSWANRYFEGLSDQNFWAKYDRRHNISVVGAYQLSKRWGFSAVWVYMTGARFTPQEGAYFVPNASYTQVEMIPIYAPKNSVSMSASHRLDVNFILKSKEKKKFKSEWHFGAYNVYNRATPYRIDVVPTGSGYQYVQPGLFGFIPSIAYNFQF